MKAAVPVGGNQALDEARTQHVHRVLLEPAVAEQAKHQYDLGPLRLLQPLLERRGDARRGEVLVLDVQRMASRGNRVEVELLDFAHGRLLAARWHGACD